MWPLVFDIVRLLQPIGMFSFWFDFEVTSFYPELRNSARTVSAAEQIFLFLEKGPQSCCTRLTTLGISAQVDIKMTSNDKLML